MKYFFIRSVLMTKSILILLCFSPRVLMGQLVLMGNQKTIIDLEGVVQVKYNNPELKPYLGVGLLGWPLPMDFDGDGDMDLLVSSGENRVFNGLYYFENKSDKSSAVFVKPIRVGDGLKNIQISYIGKDPYILGPGIEFTNFKGDYSKFFKVPVGIFPTGESPELKNGQWRYVDYDNDGDIDILVGINDWSKYGWDNAFDQDGNWKNGPLHGYILLIENIKGKYSINEKLEADGVPIDVFGMPSPNMYDFDGDGDLDLICGEFLDKLTWFENIGTREKPVFAKGRFLENEQGIIKMNLEIILPTAVDWDGDGDMDLLVDSENVAWYENTGTQKGKTIFKFRGNLMKKRLSGHTTSPTIVDWNKDGIPELVVGAEDGHFYYWPRDSDNK